MKWVYQFEENNLQDLLPKGKIDTKRNRRFGKIVSISINMIIFQYLKIFLVSLEVTYDFKKNI